MTAPPPPPDLSSTRALSPPPRAVIIGAGFAGLACAQALGGSRAEVTVVDRRNYHLFVPLLYQVATAALSPADIAHPVRRILSRYPNIEVLMGDVVEIDTEGLAVTLAAGRRLPFDRLVIAAGSEYAYFGHDDWAEFAPGLKTVEDAQEIRSRLLEAFEQAEISTDPQRQAALITTIIVGGGPTGVEMAGAVAELARFTLARDFRNVEPKAARVILVEVGPRLLAGFPEGLAAYARDRLEKLGVTVWTGRAVERIDESGAVIGGERIAAGTVVWAAGVKASRLAEQLPAPRDRLGRITVAPDLSVPGHSGIYAIGDIAHLSGADGEPLPGLAQVANQQGWHLGRPARRVRARHALAGIPLPWPRQHRHHRPQRGGVRLRQAPAEGLVRLGAVGDRPRLSAGRVREARPSHHAVALALPHLCTRGEADPFATKEAAAPGATEERRALAHLTPGRAAAGPFPGPSRASSPSRACPASACPWRARSPAWPCPGR